MEPIIKNLGKVVPTIEGDHNINNKYERLSIVYDNINGGSYISKKDVPVGILITNKEYWQPFSVGSGDYATKEYVNNAIMAAFNSYTEEELEEDFINIFNLDEDIYELSVNPPAISVNAASNALTIEVTSTKNGSEIYADTYSKPDWVHTTIV